MRVKSESEVVQSCPTLRNPMDCSPPGSTAHGVFQARVLEWGAIAFSNAVAWKPPEGGRGGKEPPLEPLDGAQPWDPLSSEVWSLGLGEDGCLWF